MATAGDHVAVDPESRLVVRLVVGKRTAGATHELVGDFHRRTGGRVMRLMTSDEYPVYEAAIRATYGVAGGDAHPAGRHGAVFELLDARPAALRGAPGRGRVGGAADAAQTPTRTSGGGPKRSWGAWSDSRCAHRRALTRACRARGVADVTSPEQTVEGG